MIKLDIKLHLQSGKLVESVVHPTELIVKTVCNADPFPGITTTCPEVGGLFIVMDIVP